MDEHETKIVSEFCHQLERSKQLFNGLRDLPQYGHKQWQSYFGKTFDVYTKLWKFQQQHRLVLDHKYGLKRWQVGEIASKIGQLYYHYYLRTSETNYLHEAFSFYSAIRSRSYYSIKPGKDDGKPELLVKKLRYYARFVVVCLLLKRLKLVRELVVELGRLVEEHGAGGGQHRPDDQHEWSKVLQEIQSFLDADAVVSVQDMDSNQVVLSHRLEPRPASATLHAGGDERPPSDALSLQEILIVGNCSSQVKFSELTIDMYRMLQTLEREPMETSAGSRNSCETPPSSATTPQNGALCSGISVARRDNPHKYLLYRPTFSQLMAFLSSGFKELPNNGVMLLYLSADGCFSTPKQPGDDRYDYGGVATDSRRDQEAAQACGWSVNAKDPNCFHPGDLLPFTRKPMFIVVDSENSPVFQSVPNYFGQPLVVLTSPQYTPSPFQEDHRNKGNLLTLFLHSPLLALCLVCNLSSISVHAWEQCSRYLDVFMTEALRLLTGCRGLDSAYQRFLADDFLRLLVLRFVFCQLVLRQHRLFRGTQFQPRAAPPLPETGLMAHPQLARSIRELFTLMDARQLLLPLNTTDAL